jgi:hypothetical protein
MEEKEIYHDDKRDIFYFLFDGLMINVAVLDALNFVNKFQLHHRIQINGSHSKYIKNP